MMVARFRITGYNLNGRHNFWACRSASVLGFGGFLLSGCGWIRLIRLGTRGCGVGFQSYAGGFFFVLTGEYHTRLHAYPQD